MAFQALMDLSPFIQIPQSFTLFMAPPAWGKTSLLLGLPGAWVFVSPLRALAEELGERLKNEGYKVKILRQRGAKEWEQFSTDPSGILIATVETLPTTIPLHVRQKCFFVLDEFHLFLQWGESFRPILLEKFFAWAHQGLRFLALTATMKDREINEVKVWVSHSFDHIFIIDVGNNRFLRRPKKIIKYGFKTLRLQRLIVWHALQSEKRGIIFCRTRAEVARWHDWFLRQKITCLACVGGEVAAFREELKNKNSVWIVTTSALSHGVNLPSFSDVYITYDPKCSSMWLQMAARGGRRGEEFTVHTVGKLSLKTWLRVMCFDVLVRARLYLRL